MFRKKNAKEIFILLFLGVFICTGTLWRYPVFRARTSAEYNVIAMCLYGSDPRYTLGAIRNAQLLQATFPGWALRFYIEDPSRSRYPKLPAAVIANLTALGAEINHIDTAVVRTPSRMWRFHVLDDPRVDRFLIRDCDSRLTAREHAAVTAWVQSGAPVHCIRDHPSHANYALNVGLWGARARPFRELTKTVKWHKTMATFGDAYIDDTTFLNSRVWPLVRAHVYCSDSVSCTKYPGSHPYPVPRRGQEHVGAVYDTKDNMRKVDTDILKKAGNNNQCSPVT